MTDTGAGFDPAIFQSELGAAAAALQDFARGPAHRAADEVGASFERAGERIARALGSAASGGEHAFKRMVKVILEELAKILLQQIFSAKGSGLSMFGARAAGGPVNVGGAYLVGERGPELFVPRQAGEIAPPATGGAVSVHIHLGGDGDAIAIARHQGQIAAAVARAVAYGRRNL